MEEELIDQTQLAESVAEKIPYELLDYVLVKTLDPIMVKKEFSTPVAKDAKKDENGIEAKDFEEVTKEIKEVESDYCKAVVLKIPTRSDLDFKFKIGDVVIIRSACGLIFDLLKDSRLVRPYDIIAVAQ